ncbi:hypothetical protein HDV05_002334 [Chytridiales sp. JEL 0842]|nr:hypothetical protein HDV05_002334 [Chytridiales sp. JEL 0842]
MKVHNILSALVAALLPTALALPSLNKFSDLPLEHQDIIRKQAPLLEAASRVRETFAVNGNPGYAGLEIQNDDTLVLHWKGSIPSDLLATLQAENATVPIQVRQTTFDFAELMGAVESMQGFFSKDEVFHSATLPIGASSIVLSGDVSAMKELRRRAEGGELKSDEELLKEHYELSVAGLRRVDGGEAFAGFPVSFKAEQKPKALQKYGDTPPWEGGICVFRRNPDGTANFCTSGFALKNPVNEKFLAFAEHCGDLNTQWYTCESNLYIGYISNIINGQDLSVIKVQNQDINSAIFDSVSRDDRTGYLRTIRDIAYTVAGEYLARSGVTSGTMVNFRATGEKVFILDKWWTTSMVQQDGLEGAEFGDSGGPIYSYVINSADGIGKGILSASGGSKVYFSEVAEFRRVYGLRV